MVKTEITPGLARKMAVQSQLLADKNHGGTQAALEIIKQLGYVQIDTISVVNRAHHQTLWARLAGYDEAMMHGLQAKERKIYEYWAHAMAYLPIENFRFSLPRMKKFHNPKSAWAKKGLEISRPIMKDVLKRIELEGPLGSKDFENSLGRKGGTWWDWKPAKIALEVLCWQGQLMVSERNKFQKIYDLTERVLPSGIDLSFPTTNEISRFIVLGALRSFGLATEKEILKYMQPAASRDAEMMLVGKKEISKCLKGLLEAGEVEMVKIERLDEDYYMLAECKSLLVPQKSPQTSVNFLSPFDNLIIQRERAKQLFGFDYSLECYTPSPKRKFGYFVFPILFGNELIGRFDPKAERKNKTLILKNLYFETGFNDFDIFIPLFTKQLVLFAGFHGCEKIAVEKCGDKKILSKINSEIKKRL